MRYLQSLNLSTGWKDLEEHLLALEIIQGKESNHVNHITSVVKPTSSESQRQT